jgi:hypothetical protein
MKILTYKKHTIYVAIDRLKALCPPVVMSVDSKMSCNTTSHANGMATPDASAILSRR